MAMAAVAGAAYDQPHGLRARLATGAKLSIQIYTPGKTAYQYIYIYIHIYIYIYTFLHMCIYIYTYNIHSGVTMFRVTL